jgi:hypothetical protein
MTNFLKQIKLIQDFNLTLEIDKKQFVEKVSALTTPDTTWLDRMKETEKPFMGVINHDHFNLCSMVKSKQNKYLSSTRLVADFSGNSQKVIINGEIQLIGRRVAYMALIVAIYFTSAIIMVGDKNDFSFIIPLMVQFVFLTGTLYFVFRNAIKSARTYFERELRSVIDISPFS